MAARAVSSLALGLFLVVLARGTEVRALGTFMTAYAVGLIIGSAVGLGAPVRILRAPAERPGLPGALYRVHTVVVCAVFGVAVLGCSAWSVVAACGLVFAWGDTVLNYAQAHLVATGRHRAGNLLILAHRLAPLVTATGLLVTSGSVAFPALAVALAIPVVLGVVVPHSASERSAALDWRSVFEPGWFGYLGYTGAAMVGQLQIPVLGAAGGASMAAAYSVAARVSGPLTLITVSLSQVLVPELARRQHDPARFRTVYRIVVLGGAGYAVIVALVSWPVARAVTALAGPQYTDATVLVAACVVAAGLSANSQGLSVKLLALGRPQRATAAILVGNVTGLVVLFGTGLSQNLRSVAWAPIVTETVVLALMVLAVTWRFPSRHGVHGGDESNHVEYREGSPSHRGDDRGHRVQRLRN